MDDEELEKQHKALSEKNAVRGTFMDEDLRKRVARINRRFRVHRNYEEVVDADVSRNILLARVRCLARSPSLTPHPPPS